MKLHVTPEHLLAILLAYILVLYGSNGLRGTDQYWYVGDTQKLMDGDTSNTTTIFFPGPILREQAVERPNYLLHNSFMLPLAAWVGQFSSAYSSWIILNFIFHVLVSLCLFYSGRKFIDEKKASWIACLYLLSPIAVWQTINPLLEMSFSAITGLCLLGYVFRELLPARLLLAAALCIGVVSHPIFLGPSLLWVLYSAYQLKNRKIEDFVYFFGFATCLFFSYVFKDRWFPSSFQPSLEAIIVSATPGKSNMFWHYSDIQPPISLKFLIEKFQISVSKHFASLRFAPFYLFTNIAVLVFLYLLCFRFRKRFHLLFPIAIFLGLYATMIVLRQNQPRYQQIISPISFFVIILAVGSVSCVLAKKIVLAVCIAMLPMNVFLAHKARSESNMESADINHLRSSLHQLPDDAKIVIVNVFPHNPITYSLVPREVLSVRTRLLDSEKIKKAIDFFEPTHVITTEESGGEFVKESSQYIESVFSSMYNSQLYIYAY